jgi:membrane protease YdiL (CAAX protease family)
MRSSAASQLGLGFALAGPAIVAVVGLAAHAAWAFLAHILSVMTIALIVLAALWMARHVDGLTWGKLGFERVSWSSIPIGCGLAIVFIVGFGPFASWMIAKLQMGTFDTALMKLSALPTWYLVITILVVASSEELLYRAYAIERLAIMLGSRWTAGALSVLAFGLAHVPLWGLGPALTMSVSGAMMTLIYLWRRDILALIIAHVATDLYGIVIAPALTTQ